MKAARIALFDDSKDTQLLVDVVLIGSEHEVVATAETRHEALEVVKLVKLGELAVDVTLLDGNLDNHNYSDAFAIYDELQDCGDNKPIVVGFSSNFLSDEGLPIPREYDMSKAGLFAKNGSSPLERLLDELPEPGTV